MESEIVRRLPRASKTVAVLLAASVALVGCGQQTGSAAIIGDVVISERDLAAVVSEAEQRALELQVPEVSSQSVTFGALEWMIRKAILESMAGKQGIEVSKGDVDAVIADAENQVGREELEAQIAGSGAGPSRLEDYARTYVLQLKLGERYGNDENALQAAYLAAGDELKVKISPRFGTWDSMQGGLAQAANDLSRPAGAAIVVPKS